MNRWVLGGVAVLGLAAVLGSVGSRSAYPTSAVCAVTCCGLIVVGVALAVAGLTKRGD